MLDAGRLQNVPIRALLKPARIDVTKNDAGSTLRRDEDIAQVSGDRWRVSISHRSYDPLELEIGRALAVVIDVDLS